MSVIARYERAEGLPWWRRTGALIACCAIAYLGVAAAVIFYLLPTGFGIAGSELVLAQAAVVVAGAVLIGYVSTQIRRGTGRRAALWALAAELGWRYRSDVSNWPWGGAIDEQIERAGRTSRDYVDATHTELPFDAAVRTFVVGERDGATIHSTLAVRIPLRTEAPRIQLRSRTGAGALSMLPRAPQARQHLRLEGNFSDVFALSVPVGYERDALYLLTPDLMAVLLDNAADLDLEIVDSTLYVYFSVLDLTNPDELGSFLAVVAALYERFGRRTALYRDEAAPLLDPETYRRRGDTLSQAARTVETRTRFGPVVSAVLAPLAPLVIGLVWMHFAG